MKKLVISLIVLLFAGNSFASTPKEFAEGIADKVIAIIEAKEPDTVREKKLIDLFKSNVDSDWMAKFVMGRFYRSLTPAQQKEYMGLYRDYVIYSYIPKFRMYAGERMSVTQVIDDSEGFYTVKSSLKTKASSTGSVLVDYKLRKVGGSYKIVDVIGEGVSLIATQRSDFSTPLNELGADEFLKRLAKKVETLKSNPPKEVKKAAN